MLGINIFFISGDSMKPLIPKNSYVISLPVLFKRVNSILIFKHEKYGDLIKRLISIDNDGNHWFKGENKQSISSENIGPIKKEDIGALRPLRKGEGKAKAGTAPGGIGAIFKGGKKLAKDHTKLHKKSEGVREATKATTPYGMGSMK